MASEGNRIVLFGGSSVYPQQDDTWQWDGTSWTLRALATKPPARAIHAMAYDAASHGLLERIAQTLTKFNRGAGVVSGADSARPAGV